MEVISLLKTTKGRKPEIPNLGEVANSVRKQTPEYADFYAKNMLS